MSFNKLHEQQGIALDAFLRDFSEKPFEILDGERVDWMPSVAIHAEIMRAIVRLLEAFLLKLGAGEVFYETTFILEYSKDWVKGSRIPDVMVYLGDRIAEYKKETPEWKSRPYAIVPDLCIEIVSPTDSYSSIDRKVDLYLEDGVKEIWVIDPSTEKIWLHTKDKSQRLIKGEVLESGILQDFKLELEPFFAAI
jgi:Uma2 family endonuclease